MEQKYRLLIQNTIIGIRLISANYGINSKEVQNYFENKKESIMEIKNEANLKGININTPQNLELNSQLSGLEAKIFQNN